MTMKCILYVSQSLIAAERDAFRTAIAEIMAEIQRNNRFDQITGALAYDRGRFIQYIEGPGDRIDALVHRLIADPRHTNMTIRMEEPAPARLFPEWSMVLLNVTAPPLAGYATADLEAQSAVQLLERLQSAAREEAILSVAPRSGRR